MGITNSFYQNILNDITFFTNKVMLISLLQHVCMPSQAGNGLPSPEDVLLSFNFDIIGITGRRLVYEHWIITQSLQIWTWRDLLGWSWPPNSRADSFNDLENGPKITVIGIGIYIKCLLESILNLFSHLYPIYEYLFAE